VRTRKPPLQRYALSGGRLIFLALIAIAFASTTVFAQTTNPNNHQRDAYVTKTGTYVAPSHATNPNDTKTDNYSAKGNVNPYTGKEGTKDPYATPRDPYAYKPHKSK